MIFPEIYFFHITAWSGVCYSTYIKVICQELQSLLINDTFYIVGNNSVEHLRKKLVPDIA